MAVFPYHELRYYFFGLRTGLANLFINGFRLGTKKTFGKITQPINAATRYPEYHFFEAAIADYLRGVPAGQPLRVLDVGSPKLMGLYLAAHTSAELTLTDISDLNVDEYRVMWKALEPKARGKAVFSLEDARSLRLADGEFDVVYSMSVVEHIEGDSGDGRAIEEMMRVLKPGGLLLVSVPFGGAYVEQQIVGFSGAVRATGDSQTYFFQRIYDPPSFESRILGHARGLEQVQLTTVWRKNRWIQRSFGALGTNLRGLLGFLTPLMSAAMNRSRAGMDSGFPVQYGKLHSPRDVYGDLILAGRKQQRRPA